MSVRARPTFVLETDIDKGALIPLVQNYVTASDDLEGQFTGFHAMVSVKPRRRHFWSPWLHLDVRASESSPDKHCVFGRFSPHPTIWTALMFSWLAIGVICFFSVMLAIAQQLAGLTPWAYWMVPIGIVVAIILWVFSQIGQRLAQDEMTEMRGLVEQCLVGPDESTGIQADQS